MKNLIVLFCALFLCACQRIEKHTETCKILSIDKQVETSGTKQSISTRIYWLVVTDKGSFHIVTDGLWACPDAVGRLQIDSVYNLTIDGFYQSSFLGVYPYIVQVNKS